MERSHYRRQTPASRYGKQPVKKSNIKEIILRQCIISGIIFAAVLILHLFDTDITQNMRADIHTALSESMSADDIKLTANKTVHAFTDMENSVKTILGGTADEPAITEPVNSETSLNESNNNNEIQRNDNNTNNETQQPNDNSINAEMQLDTDAQEMFQQMTPSSNFRIDEDILADINSKQ